MSKRTSICATYKLSESELIQATVSIASNYPDAVSEAKATVMAMMKDTLTDVLAQTRTDEADAE